MVSVCFFFAMRAFVPSAPAGLNARREGAVFELSLDSVETFGEIPQRVASDPSGERRALLRRHDLEEVPRELAGARGA